MTTITISDDLAARLTARVAEEPCIVVTEDNLEFWWDSRERCERWITRQQENPENVAHWQNIGVNPMDFHVIDNTIERVLQNSGLF